MMLPLRGFAKSCLPFITASHRYDEAMICYEVRGIDIVGGAFAMLRMSHRSTRTKASRERK